MQPKLEEEGGVEGIKGTERRQGSNWVPPPPLRQSRIIFPRYLELPCDRPNFFKRRFEISPGWPRLGLVSRR